MKSVMSHQFSQVPRAEIQRSQFDRSHGYKTTFDAGYLIPFFVDEALPGDTFNLRTNIFGRLATPLKPIMDNLFLDTQFFAVPIRLIWENWQKFNGEQANPGDSTSYVVPEMTSTAVTGYLAGSLHDYFGLPTEVPGLVHSSLFHRAYNLIWREWYRDQNLQNSPVVDTDDGPDSPADYVLLQRGKRHDYFTSCLPWPQKGTAVDLPLGTSAPVYALDGATNDYLAVLNGPGGAARGLDANVTEVRLSSGLSTPSAMLEVDLQNASAATINQLRQAFAVQRLYERDARGGTRYVEVIKAHFGVESADLRPSRPEYLGGGVAAG